MKTRQRTLKLFEFEAGASSKEYIAFIQKHLPLLKHHTLGFKDTIDSELLDFLNANNLSYSTLNALHIKEFAESSKEAIDSTPDSTQNAESSALWIERVIRSGEELHHSGDMIVLSQVNSGAHIVCEGNLVLFQPCKGNIEANGDFIICQDINAPAALFGGVLLDSTFLRKINQSNAKFKILFKQQDKVMIKDLV